MEELPIEFDIDLPRLPAEIVTEEEAEEELGVKVNFTAPTLPVVFVTEALPKQT